LFAVDLKYIYYTILLYRENRHYFVFIISSIDQLQSTRIQQKSQLIRFTIIELVYRAFEFISLFYLEFSLLYLDDLVILSSITFYINNFFDEFRDFDYLFIFSRDYFFLRVK